MLAGFGYTCCLQDLVTYLQDFVWSTHMLAGFHLIWSIHMLPGFGYMLADFHMEWLQACRISYGVSKCLQDLIWSTHMLAGFGCGPTGFDLE
jgi:hypothetical protein